MDSNDSDSYELLGIQNFITINANKELSKFWCTYLQYGCLIL